MDCNWVVALATVGLRFPLTLSGRAFADSSVVLYLVLC